jgi:hypothetical protein
LFPLCIHFPAKIDKGRDRVATKRKQESALSPLTDSSKKLFEVLRLGLGELGSTDPRTSIRASGGIFFSISIGALPPGRGRGGAAGGMRGGVPSPRKWAGSERPIITRRLSLQKSPQIIAGFLPLL